MGIRNLPVFLLNLFGSRLTGLGTAQTQAATTPSVAHETVFGHANITSYRPEPLHTGEGFVIAKADIEEDFSGELSGQGSSHLILATESATGSVQFTGIERFTGKLGDKSGSFLFQNSGLLDNGVLHSTWRIVAGSGTDALTGIRGEGGCGPEGCRLEYWFQ